MADSNLEIRNLLLQDRLIILELLDSSARLVLEVECTHHWIHHTLENYKMLSNIGRNLEGLLGECSEHWGEGKKVFQREEAMKLFRTALGLFRALPPIQAKYTEQLSRRRRQRIMGEELVEIEGLDAVMVANDKASVQRMFSELRELYDRMEQRINAIPEGLVPELKQPAAEPNGHREESSIPGVQIADKPVGGGAAQPPASSPGTEPTGSSPL